MFSAADSERGKAVEARLVLYPAVEVAMLGRSLKEI